MQKFKKESLDAQARSDQLKIELGRAFNRWSSGESKDTDAKASSSPVNKFDELDDQEAFDKMAAFGVSGFPVVDDNGRLLGIVTKRDLRAAEASTPIQEVMTKDPVTGREGVARDEAMALMVKRRVEKLPVVDENRRLLGLITVKDFEKSELYPNATKDDEGRLRVGAAIGFFGDAWDRACALRDAGVDILTLGQYLRPTVNHLEVRRYVSPAEFAAYREQGLALGFREVVAGPLVRSSYRADRVLEQNNCGLPAGNA
jgi:IMP dehydrogenase